MRRSASSARVYSSTRVRGLATWRPQAKTLKLHEKVEAILDEYREHLPLLGRQVFYRLVGAHGYPKDERASERVLNLLNRARRSGRIPFDAIRDDGAVAEVPLCFDGRTHFLEMITLWAQGYRRDRQDGQPQVVELWCEAAGMVPQLVRVAEPYGVAVYSSGGFESLAVKHEAAQRIADRTCPTVVLQVGDFDPSGCAIFDSAADDVSTLAADLGSPNPVEFRRVAVTEEQIERYGLPEAPAKSTDRRGDWSGGTVQAEALAPDQLRDEVLAAVLELFDLEQYERVLSIERDERESLEQVVAGLEGQS